MIDRRCRSKWLHGPDPDAVITPSGGEAGAIRMYMHRVYNACLPLLAKVAYAQGLVEDHPLPMQKVYRVAKI